MANLRIFFPTLLAYEGGYVNIPEDNGGPTNKGIILSVWKKYGRDIDGDGDIDIEDLKRITIEDAYKIYKSQYWDKIKGSDIDSQSVAEIFFDYAVNSGISRASKDIQRILKFRLKDQDGIIGPMSIKAINASNPRQLFNLIKERRIEFYHAIVRANPSQKKFLNGWLNRVNSFHFKS